MRRKILIVGAGQSGLQLALGLQQHDYDVTVMSARTPREIRVGRVMSTQVMFGPALARERALGLGFWDDQAPPIDSIQVTVAGQDGDRMLNWIGYLDEHAQSVDQRLKMSVWLEEFENLGGKVVIHGSTHSDLDRLAEMCDLTIVAAGRGELAGLFQRDPQLSPYTQPQRKLAVTYVRGLDPHPDYRGFRPVNINLIPGAGELFIMPALTTTGPCDILFFEGIPGGDLDCFANVTTGQEHLKLTLQLMEKFTPWEYERASHVQLTDQCGFLSGSLTPVVRDPVGRLPGGGVVLGMGDSVVTNDPITGQGANNAAHCAAIYQQAILDHGGGPFDQQWMRATFARYLDYVLPVTRWTNAMLLPPPEHVLAILAAAQENSQIRQRFANGFSDPADFSGWLMDPDKATEYLRAITEGPAPLADPANGGAPAVLTGTPSSAGKPE